MVRAANVEEIRRLRERLGEVSDRTVHTQRTRKALPLPLRTVLTRRWRDLFVRAPHTSHCSVSVVCNRCMSSCRGAQVS